jgi:hypothetical protein
MAEQEVIDRETAEKHAELMRRFYDGFTGMCHALHEIREGKTYRAQGCASWTEFLESQHISASNGRLMANAWPVLQLLERYGLHEYVKHVDILRPIHKIPNPNRQVAIIRTAIEDSKKQMVPLTPKFIQGVAEKKFGWIPQSKYSKGARRRRQGPEPDDPMQHIREDLERAFRVIANCGMSGFDVAQAWPLDELESFSEAYQLMQDAMDA